MTTTPRIDLSQLPAPEVIEELSFEAILNALKADLIKRVPDIASVLDLESEPAVKILEVFAYRETLLRARINDAAKAVMIAFAAGSDLDQLAALFGVTRLVVVPAEPEANPPVPAVPETDAALRTRVQLALDGFSVAGPIGAYVFHAKSASGQVKDVSVESPKPGEVLVTVLSTTDDGTASQDLLDSVDLALRDDRVRPLTDKVRVQSASVTTYTVAASLILYPGPDSGLALQNAQARIEDLVRDLHLLGRDVNRAAIFGALYQKGVTQDVIVTSPATSIEVPPDRAAFCVDIALTVGGTDV